jgi:hypothetical protein
MGVVNLLVDYARDGAGLVVLGSSAYEPPKSCVTQ